MKKMKNFFILIIFVILITGCSKKNNEEIKQSQESQPVRIEQPKKKEFRYVNSIEGLRIRNKPGTDAEKIGFLKNKEKIEIVSETSFIQIIDKIESTWVEIKTENNITGYVFGGFLEKNLETIDIIQNAEGEYKNKDGMLNLTIKYQGMQEFNISVTAPFLLEPKITTVSVENIYRDVLFYSSIDEQDGLDGYRVIKFDNDKNLCWHEAIFESEFDETGIHNIEILEKIT